MLRGGATNRLAFTLAEVLSTLAIIGVVAALTIPSVVTNYRNQEIVSRLKKTYSAISNTTNLAIADHGPINSWHIPPDTENNGQHAKDFVDRYMLPYLRISKDCGNVAPANDPSSDCTYEFTTLSNETYGGYTDSSTTKFYMADGTFVSVRLVSSTFGTDELSQYASIYIDVNGKQKPNTFGRDIFTFGYSILAKNKPVGKLLPFRPNDTNAQLSARCAIGAVGDSCSHIIIKNGWKIPTKEEYVTKFSGDINNYPWSW